jgi:hypothetical protein
MKDASPKRQLATFLARYTPEMRAAAEAALTTMRRLLPGAIQLVYDNYNALVIGFGPTERAGDAVFSIAVYPRWVTLFFLEGARLKDPMKLLKGSGKIVRHIVLKEPSVLEDPAVRELIRQALEASPTPIVATGPSRIVIKSVSAKQRPRKPG